MDKALYLIILFVLYLRGWDVKPIGNMSSDVQLILILLFFVYGILKYKNRRFSLRSKRFNAFWWIVAGMVLSMVPAAIYHGQSILQSVITYRMQLLWIGIPVVVMIAPTEKDIYKATFITTIIMYFMMLLKTLMPSMFVTYDDSAILSDEIGCFLNGYMIPCVPIFMSLGRMKKKFELKSLLVVFICLVYIFLVQNRSTLFPMILISGYSLLKIKSKYKPIIITCLILTALLVFYQTRDIWLSLFEETAGQLDSEDYNRNKAFIYFLSSAANPGFLTYILGNGFLSAHTNSLMEDMRNYGVFNSDVGFIGFWNQFGIIPVVVFIWLILSVFSKKKKYPYYLKMWALLLMADSLTTCYFGTTNAMIVFILYYYAFSLYRYPLPYKRIRRKQKTSYQIHEKQII